MSLHRYSNAAALIVMCMLCACEQWQPNYCPTAPHHNCLELGGPPDPSCARDQDCFGATAVCDVNDSMTCVQCTNSKQAACTGTTPVCSAEHICRGCTAHAQCASNACLPDGSCGDENRVAYVDPTGTDIITTGNICTKRTPCRTVVTALATNRPYVKFHGTTDEDVVISNGRVVTFLADPDAKLTRTRGNGAILTVRDSGTSLSVYDLSISDAPNSPSGIGCVIPTASGAPSLKLARVKVMHNPGGGISISGAQFSITNSIIAANGSGISALGGVQINNITVGGTHVIDFNTITANFGPATIHTGVACSTVIPPLTFSNNIIYANIVSGGGAQVGGDVNCSTSYSDIGPGAVIGQGNINQNPLFVSLLQNFHLMATSPARDAADPAAKIADDIDGDARPQGPRRDMGADEIK